MASFITQESIDEVSDKTDIVRVVGEYVPLVQKGGDWWGCCPFHNEKTPSFSVSSSKKFYYCFGCHASGTVFNFIMNMEKLSYPAENRFQYETSFTAPLSFRTKRFKNTPSAR